MTGELTAYCNHYYQLSKLLSKREERLSNLIDNAPFYCGQSSLSEVDAIISYYRNAQAVKAKVDKTLADMKETAGTILVIMRHFGIPPGTVLTGEIPGELEYELWADEDEAVHIGKTKDIAGGVDEPNVMVIKLWDEGEGNED